jgi:aldehyde dehydrogenase (NAD+)
VTTYAAIEGSQRRSQLARASSDGLATTQVGPITTRLQHKKVLDYIAIGEDEGAQLVLGGKAAAVEGSGSGLFIQPSIFAGVNNQMRIAQEEIFGPVLSVIPFHDEEEARADLRLERNDTLRGRSLRC